MEVVRWREWVMGGLHAATEFKQAFTECKGSMHTSPPNARIFIRG